MQQDCVGLQPQSYGFEVKLTVGGHINNGMKFLQQALLHLWLWFKVYIGSGL